MNLEYLFCNDNRLRRLPESIGECTSLKTLSCAFNELERIPDSILNVPLNGLYVDANKLTALLGGIASDSTLSKSLWSLRCAANRLTKLSAGLGHCARLNVLVAKDNHLTSIPVEIRHCCMLTTLALHGNPLEGDWARRPDESHGDYMKRCLGKLTIARDFYSPDRCLPGMALE